MRYALRALLSTLIVVAAVAVRPAAAQSPDPTAALLALDDLPGGWSGGPTEASGRDTPCGVSLAEIPDPVAAAGARYEHASGGRFVLQLVTVNDVGDAERLVSLLRDQSLP